MADVKHTPGPWTSYPCNLERYSQVITANGAMVQIAMTKEIYGDCKTYGLGEETTANARLIAAAPDLLEALQMLLEFPNTGPATSAAREAITKATGAARATEGGV